MEWINLAALVIIPILAVIIAQNLQDRSEKRKDKMRVFSHLMSYRSFGYVDQYSVNVFNSVPIVFYDDKEVIEKYTSQSTFKKIEELKDKYEIITVCNHICHIKKGLPINKLTRGVCKNKNSVLLIQENGDFYRCFNCSVPDDKEGNIFDKDFLLKVKKCNTGYYSYCPWCTHYE